ncbi:tyrosine--tRNA ligase [Zavarzinella formosa]|uniref:tyrosine--tRNA ligase n=1 Tax=Zavarzinella formosa TaxID=360055 RepID=UPI0002F0BA73|nr:tyrosine--tRNA ligase [Zavarzinella formosa]
MKSVDEQLELIRRGVDQIEPVDGLRKKLEHSAKTGKPLRVKYGIDPTGIDVHLGHTVPLRKLKLFQELGHQAVLIIGNYTALVGDPTGRSEMRTRLTPEQVELNAKDYLKQIGRIIDLSKSEVRFNGEWFGKFTFLDVLSLTGKITVQRMLERDDFSKRFHARPESVPIYLHECLYPLMQGHDSVEIKADIELGGSEQLFNLMMGRRLQEADGQVPQVCVTLPILRGLDGVRRMGKSLGNYVGVGESADDQFSKTMSIPDDLLKEWYTLLTDRPLTEIEELCDSVKTAPFDAKKQLSRDIVGFYHGPDAEPVAQTNWVKRVSEKKDPDIIPEVNIPSADAKDPMGILKLLVLVGFCKSNNEARQKVTEGAVNIGPERIKLTDWKTTVPLEDGLVIRLGSRNIAKIRIQ